MEHALNRRPSDTQNLLQRTGSKGSAALRKSFAQEAEQLSTGEETDVTELEALVWGLEENMKSLMRTDQEIVCRTDGLDYSELTDSSGSEKVPETVLGEAAMETSACSLGDFHIKPK
ncbi:hypothetical protein EYF80_044685 [Liparis tanakae]|uniref:Uncharacterized protein n=1 Tax=Liparis tanakae TaxID=230148 RepID=A0A4Z2FXP0_9TELE|nr:hypothetical protein EYF80_044685 [Liparis tanakae]